MLDVPDFPSALVSDDPEGHVSDEQLKADRIVVEQAAAHCAAKPSSPGMPASSTRSFPRL
jgi:hypothetical protein